MSCLHPSYPQGHFTALHCHPHAQYCYLHDGGGIITGRGEGELLVAGQICFIPAGWEHEFRVLRRSRLSLLYVPTSARTAFGPLQASPLLAGLFARLPLTGELDPRLLRVLDRVCQAPAIHLTLTALAADCGASVRTLNRLFLQQLGCSFRQWRELVVLGRARQLQHRGLTLAQIADRLGYEDPGALSRALQRLARREPAA